MLSAEQVCALGFWLLIGRSFGSYARLLGADSAVGASLLCAFKTETGTARACQGVMRRKQAGTQVPHLSCHVLLLNRQPGTNSIYCLDGVRVTTGLSGVAHGLHSLPLVGC